MLKLCVTVRLSESADLVSEQSWIAEQSSIAVWVSGSLVGEGVKGLHIKGYSVPCVFDTRDGIPLKEI